MKRHELSKETKTLLETINTLNSFFESVIQNIKTSEKTDGHGHR